jgi:heme/copper-type cytochrome/quinol oxidase subunit 2
MQTPSALWSPALAPTITSQPSQQPQAQKTSMTSENYLIAATIVLGVMLFLSIIHTLHYNNKYKKEKRKYGRNHTVKGHAPYGSINPGEPRRK